MEKKADVRAASWVWLLSVVIFVGLVTLWLSGSVTLGHVAVYALAWFLGSLTVLLYYVAPDRRER